MAPELTSRFARPDDVPAAARLAAHSFPARGRPLDAWEQVLGKPIWGGGPETLLLGEAHGRLVAAAQLHPLRQWIAGALLPVAGVGTVAVSPAYRKRGAAARLVEGAFRHALERGDVASALYPFRVSFYRALGYGAAGEALQHQVPTSTLPDAPERAHVEVLENQADQEEALALYGAWAASQTGQLQRSPALWREVLAGEQRALFGWRAPSGELAGYALVAYRSDLPPGERFLEVDELVWITSSARQGLVGWLASLGDQWSQVVVRTLPEQRFGDLLAEPRLPPSAPLWRLWYPAANVLHGPMFRILDLRAAWEARRTGPGASLAAGLEVTDTQVPENAGWWRLVLDAGRTAVDRGADVQLTLRLDVSALSRLYVGALAPTAALTAGLLECDRPELLPLLDPLLALPQPWTFDRF